MLSGWLLSFAALILLAGEGGRLAFIAAAFMLEIVGLGAIAQFYRSKRGEL